MCVPGADSCVSCSPSQFHNKVTCFMLQQIEEPCSLGAHAGVIVPPSWIIKVRKPQVQQALSNWVTWHCLFWGREKPCVFKTGICRKCAYDRNKPDALACKWDVRLTLRFVQSSAAWSCLPQFVLNVLPFDITEPSGFICIVCSLYHYMLLVKKACCFCLTFNMNFICFIKACRIDQTTVSHPHDYVHTAGHIKKKIVWPISGTSLNTVQIKKKTMSNWD